MNISTRTRLASRALALLSMATVMSAVGLGCAAETDEAAQAPDVSLETLDERDEGTSYGGWTQSVFFNLTVDYGWGEFSHAFARSSGDATRGGGACITHKAFASCSSDTTCTATAQSLYGSSAWGYCYQSQCYLRPGDQSNCALSPNRTPGELQGFVSGFSYTGEDYVVGCMTKTAGPNTACGGTNGSLYLRTIRKATYHFGQPR